MTFGDHLKEFIESKKYSKEEYLDRFEMSYFTIHKYFQNKSLPGYEFLFRLKKAGFNVNKIFTSEVYEDTIAQWEIINNKKRSNSKTPVKEYSQVAEGKAEYNAK
jgi:transcriptional regulator with XRE-family HTH domain